MLLAIVLVVWFLILVATIFFGFIRNNWTLEHSLKVIDAIGRYNRAESDAFFNGGEDADHTYEQLVARATTRWAAYDQVSYSTLLHKFWKRLDDIQPVSGVPDAWGKLTEQWPVQSSPPNTDSESV